MHNDFFIKIIVRNDISPENLNKVYVKLQRSLPRGILTSRQQNVDGKLCSVKYIKSKTKDKHVMYIFPLMRHLTDKEQSKCIEQMNFNKENATLVFSDNMISNPDDNWIYDISDELLEDLEIIEQRIAHKKKVDEMLDDGWRFSFDYDKEEKTHPLLRPWSELPSAVHPKRYDFK